MSKKAFLVLGPESSGTRLVTQCLVAAGCDGDSSHEQRFDRPSNLGQAGNPIVWRRSLPHGHGWPDLDFLLRALWLYGYQDIQVIALVRTHYCSVRSQVHGENRHAGSYQQAERNIAAAIRRIASFVLENNLPVRWVTYESIAEPGQRESFVRMLGEWGLDTSKLPEIRDENRKYLTTPPPTPALPRA